jgi:hypothetical protein
MFKKLNIQLNIDLKRLRGKLIGVSAGAGYFIEYEIADQSYLHELLANTVEFQIPPDQFLITKISFGGGLTPHRDNWDTALNYYIHAEDEVTTFYRNLSENNNLSVGLTHYDLTQLAPISNFIANTNDCYLLNTAVPHNVSYNVKNSSRTFLRIIWNKVPFEEVLKSIRLKNDKGSVAEPGLMHRS